MKKTHIAIVNSSSFATLFPEHLETLEAFAEVSRITLPLYPTQEEFVSALAGVDAVISGITPLYSRQVLAALPDLKIIARHGIGIDNIDAAAACEYGIVVSRTPGHVERNSVAEHALTLILSICRRIVEAIDLVRAGEWRRRAEIVGTELYGKRIGLIGIGDIGGRLCEILRVGFNCEVLAYDPLLSDDEIAKRGATPCSLPQVLQSCDIVSLHCPLTPMTRKMFNTRTFSLMPKGAILINTARGEIIDEDALYRALDSGHLGGFGADVVANAAVAAKDHPLLKFPNVLIVPHLGAYTKSTLKKMGDSIVDDVRRVLVEGEMPRNPVVTSCPAYRFSSGKPAEEA